MSTRRGARNWNGPGISRRDVLTGIGAGGAALVIGGLAACTRREDPTNTNPAVPGGSPAELFAQPAELRSDAGGLDVNLVAEAATVAFGETTRWALTYNGITPGPTLRVRPGDAVTVTLENRLDRPTNLHTHGLHVSPEGDSDNVFVMVEPGGRHTYRYQIPADHPSGTFWYHPHHHGNVADQVHAGLAGMIIVEDALDDLPELAAATARVMVLADPTIGDSAGVLGTSMMGQMQGREGNAIVLNGQQNPRIDATTGTVEHWRFVNASASRYYALRLDGHPFHVIASDGGRLNQPAATDELVLVPGERAEVLITLTASGTHQLTTRTVDRGGMGMMGGGGGMGGGMGGPTTGTTTAVATLSVTGDDREPPPLPTALADTADLAATPADRSRTVTLAMAMGMGMGGGGDGFTIDGRSFDPDRVDITADLDTVEDWTITNTSPMDHPFHLHVWPFQVLDDEDRPPGEQGWKDTINVPAGRSVRIRIPFRDFAGTTVYHCHILDHEDLGMMGVIDTRTD